MTGNLTISDPFAFFAAWFEEAEREEPNDPNAMALATLDADGKIGLRMVLLKGVDAVPLDSLPSPKRGFLFYTNLESRKGRALAANAHAAALLFHWKSLRRQIRIEGRVFPVADEDADAYFASRPRASRIGAWSSAQSRPMVDEQELIRNVAKQTVRFGLGKIPRPPYWSGYRLVPARMEFWISRPSRLHERFQLDYDETAPGEWRQTFLFP